MYIPQNDSFSVITKLCPSPLSMHILCHQTKQRNDQNPLFSWGNARIHYADLSFRMTKALGMQVSFSQVHQTFFSNNALWCVDTDNAKPKTTETHNANIATIAAIQDTFRVPHLQNFQLYLCRHHQPTTNKKKSYLFHGYEWLRFYTKTLHGSQQQY